MDDKIHLLIADVKRLENEIEFLKASQVKSRSEEILTYDAFNRTCLLIKDLQDDNAEINNSLKDIVRKQKRNIELTELYVKKVDKIQEQLDNKKETECCTQEPEAVRFAEWLGREGYKPYLYQYWSSRDDNIAKTISQLYEKFKKEYGNLK